MPNRYEIEDYGGFLTDFDIHPEDLAGKRILDIGAGARLFAYDALTQGTGRVISLDKDPAGWFQVARWANNQLQKGANPDAASWLAVNRASLGADAIRLPFPNQSFDLVFSRSVIPQMLENEGQMRVAFAEIIRILAADGTAHLYPFIMFHWEADRIEMTQNAFLSLDHTGLEISAQSILFRDTNRPGMRLTIKRHFAEGTGVEPVRACAH